MSKSLGNFITIKDLLEEYPPEVFRFFVLSTHYRSPIDFSQEILEQSQSGLKRIYKLTETIEDLLESDIPENNSHDLKHQELIQETRKNFFEAMDNDFNTPFALSSIFDFIREINRDINESNVSKSILTDVREFINEIGNILGFDFVLNKSQADVSDDLVHILTDVREKLREKKEYELSDEIRSRLKDLDIVIEDRN